MELLPRISIILPTHNRVELLSRAIQSVISQTYQQWELIVINDASTDETSNILKAWQEKDARIRVITNAVNRYPDISGILNRGIDSSQGEYIARLDDDDYWCDKEKLKKQVKFLDGHPAYALVGGGMIGIDTEGRELFRYLKREHDSDIRRYALFANPFSHTTVMFRKAVADAVGGYSKLSYAEDWDLWLKMGMKGKLHNIGEYFTMYTIAGQNKSLLHQGGQIRTTLQIIKAHRNEYPFFFPAYLLNFCALLYSFLPFPLRKKLHAPLSHFKRKVF